MHRARTACRSQRAADKTSRAGRLQGGFPDQARRNAHRPQLHWCPTPRMRTFEGKMLYKGGPTRLVTPQRRDLKGRRDRLHRGPEPRTQANIYDVKAPTFKVAIEGSGLAAAAAQTASSRGQRAFSIEQIMPRRLTEHGVDPGPGSRHSGAGLHSALSRRQSSRLKRPAPPKGKNERRRR